MRNSAFRTPPSHKFRHELVMLPASHDNVDSYRLAVKQHCLQITVLPIKKLRSHIANVTPDGRHVVMASMTLYINVV